MATLQIYGKHAINQYGGETAGESRAIDILSDAIKASLHTTSYVPNVDTHELAADLTNEAANGNGYTTGGVTLTPTAAYTAVGGFTTIGAAVFQWTASGAGITFRYVVLRDTTVSGEPLIGFMDCGSQTIVSPNILKIDPTASGLWTVTVTGA